MDDIPFKELSYNARAQRRAVIVRLTKMGIPAKKIEELAHCSKTARQNTVKKYKELGHFEDNPRSGRPRKYTNADVRELTRSIDSLEADTAVEAAALYNSTRSKDEQLSDRTVQAILRRSGRPGRVKPTKPYLSKKMTATRLEWAHTMKQRAEHGKLDWEMTVFTDESKFTRQGSEGRSWYRKQALAPFQPSHVKPRFHSGGFSVFCYGAISWYGVSELVFLPTQKVNGSQVTATGATLEEWVQNILYPAWDKWNQRTGYPMAIVHDNDKKAWTERNKKQHQELGMEFLEWPGNSPDMNCIEWAWGWVDMRLKDRSKYPSLPESQEELMQRVKNEWYSIPLPRIQRWIQSMPRRIDALIASKGNNTTF